MQIRVQTFRDKDRQLRQGKTVSLLRYAYDPAKQRSKQIVIGTVDRLASALPPELESILTDVEREAFREWVAERDQQFVELAQRYYLLHAAEYIGWAAKALAVEVEPIRPERIWDAMDVLAKALEKAGYPRPARARGRPTKDETPTPDDLVANPYDDPMLAAEEEDLRERMAALPNFIPLLPATRKGKGTERL